MPDANRLAALSRGLQDCPPTELLEILQTVLLERPDVLQELVDWAVPDYAYGSARSLTETRYPGVIKSFNAAKGYGFISSPEIIDAFGMDMFVSDRQIHGFDKGDAVTFAILLNKGKPQAFDLAAAGGSSSKSKGKGIDGTSNGNGAHARNYGLGGACGFPGKGGFSGVNSAWPGLEKGSLGACWSPAQNEWGAEVPWRTASSAPWNSNVGMVRSNDHDKPAISEIGPSPASRVEIQGVTDERYTGLVKSSKPGKFGFLTCADLQQSFNGQDIYVHFDQLGNFRVGDTVSFAVIVNEKGGVKAIDLRDPSEGDEPCAKRSRSLR